MTESQTAPIESPETDSISGLSLFRTLFAANPDPVILHNGRTVIEVNAAAARAFELDGIDNAPGKELLDFVHPEDRAWVAKRIQALAADLPAVPPAIERFITMTGNVIHGDTIAEQVIFEGKPAVLTIIRDVTDRVRAEEAARATEESQRMLFELSPDPSIVHDSHIIFKANRAWGRLMGIDPDAIAGTSLWPYIQEEYLVPVRAVLRAGNPIHDPQRAVLIRPNGDEIFAEITCSPIDFEGHRAHLTVFRDLTARISAEQQAESYREQLEQLVAERTAELVEVRTELDSIVAVVMRIVELRDPYTAGHQERVAELADAMAEYLDMDDEEKEHLAVAARLHDLGKVTVPAEILAKPWSLGPVEYALVKGHAQASTDILRSVRLDWPLADTVGQHHERLDGSGYPQGLVGDEILPLARVLAVADVVEAMCSHRPYRPALGLEVALDEVVRGQGTLYDPAAVRACLEAFEHGFEFTGP